MGDMMKAVNYQGAFSVKVEEVPMPKLEHPDDIIVKVTTSGTYMFHLLLMQAEGGGLSTGRGSVRVGLLEGLPRRQVASSWTSAIKARFELAEWTSVWERVISSISFNQEPVANAEDSDLW